jgi:hypothetical protein
MKKFLFYSVSSLTILYTMSCNNNSSEKTTAPVADKKTYATDAAFLKKHAGKMLELQNADGTAKVLLSAEYQGRVMTSTANGDTGSSFGWINYSLLETGQKKKQFNPIGGEERFWLGPEGGQYSLYFKGGDSFNIAHWQVPALIDTAPYDVVTADKTQAVFSKKASIQNYSGTQFDISIERTVRLLDEKDAAAKLKISIPSGIKLVGYETQNRLQNTGNADWTPDKGLMSIWLLGMFTPSPKTVVIIPFSKLLNPAAGQTTRNYITDNYFGNIPAERLQVKDSVLYFTADGKFRSKIGISPLIAKPMAASFDFENNVLTILIPQVSSQAPYVNSKWELQKEPYKGDVINSYNDGPLADGTQMGPFYEIESSSPALQLNKGQTGEYKQSTFHLQGNYNELKQLALQLLGVQLDELKK